VSELSAYGLTSHSIHNRSCLRWVFPGNQLHWYWQPKTRKQNTTYIQNIKDKRKSLPQLTNKLSPGLVHLLWPSATKRSGPYSYNPKACTTASTAQKEGEHYAENQTKVACRIAHYVGHW